MSLPGAAALKPDQLRKHLLECGVAVEIDRRAADLVLGLDAGKATACSIIEVEDGRVLLAVTSETEPQVRDALLWEAMKSPRRSKTLLRLADTITLAKKFERASVAIELEDDSRRKVTGQAIGCWIAHKTGIGWSVTHTITGAALAQGLRSRKTAEQLASILEYSPYPWRRFRYTKDHKAPIWSEARAFAIAAVREAHRREDDRMAANPPRQKALIPGVM